MFNFLTSLTTMCYVKVCFSANAQSCMAGKPIDLLENESKFLLILA